MCLCFRRWHRLYRSDGLCTKTFIPRVEKRTDSAEFRGNTVGFIFSSFPWRSRLSSVVLITRSSRAFEPYCCLVFDEIGRSSEPAAMFTCLFCLLGLENHDRSSWDPFPLWCWVKLGESSLGCGPIMTGDLLSCEIRSVFVFVQPERSTWNNLVSGATWNTEDVCQDGFWYFWR